MADLTGAATGVRDIIGRYFSLVSAVPSALLVLWIFLLVSSGAWSGRPDPGRAFEALSRVGVAGAIGLVLGALAVGLTLHPVQYGVVQFLEGYWGTSRLAQRALVAGVRRHAARREALYDELRSIERRIDVLTVRIRYGSERYQIPLAQRQGQLLAQRNEIERVLGQYPDELSELMPTRLGNVLRRHERLAGAPWGIDAVVVLPYLSRVAAPGDMDYVNDQRSQLDLAVRMVLVAGVAAVVTAVFLARHGPWMVVTLVPYGAGYLAYRGAVVVAAEYGRSLSVVISLNRFSLYERLRIAVPTDSSEEADLNEYQLTHYLAGYGSSSGPLRYTSAESLNREGYL